MALARRGRERGIDYWPGFVDALSTLILGIVFLLSVFVIVQFFLSQEVTGKDTALQRLNSQIAQLTELLSMEKSGKASLEETLASLRASLSGAESDRELELAQPLRDVNVDHVRHAASRHVASAIRRQPAPRPRESRQACSGAVPVHLLPASAQASRSRAGGSRSRRGCSTRR